MYLLVKIIFVFIQIYSIFAMLEYILIGMRIKEVLKEKGVTAKELAKRLNITQASMSTAINGNPTVETLERIAAALGVQVVDLFERPADESPTGVCPHCGKPIRIHFDK